MDTKPTSVSVVVCTLGDSELLGQTLTSLQEQTYPDELCEIIVVDNGPEERALSVVSKANRQGKKNIEYLKERELGLSNARNTGVLAAKGDVIAFIDDDAVADPEWISSLVQVYMEQDASCVGGKVVPIWSKPPPDWLHEELHLWLSILDLGPEVKELFGRWCPAGTNTSFKRSAFDKIGLFDPKLGRKGYLLASGEEDDLCYRLEKIGRKRFYTPKAIVHHLVPISRLRKRWFLTRAYWQGRANASARIMPSSLKTALVNAAGFFWFVVKGDPKKSFLHLFWLCYDVGYFIEGLKRVPQRVQGQDRSL